MLPFSVHSDDDHSNVATVRMAGTGGSEFWFLLVSDNHHDHPDCDQRMERKHLQEAKDRGAGVIIAGDFHCVMQGKFDKRSSKNAIRVENQKKDYFNSIIKSSADFLGPFAENLIVIGDGNHETAVLKNHEIDLNEMLVETLNERHKTKIQHGGYSGWVRFMFARANYQTARNLYYYHGTGGGGPVTRGVIQTSRLAVFTPDADIVLTGHTHDTWVVPIGRNRINHQGKLYQDEQLHIRSGGYKDGWGTGVGGFEVEKMLGPKPKGAAWIKFTMHRDRVDTHYERAT